jgi:predicted DNA-binding transcriptional regulator AlpA
MQPTSESAREGVSPPLVDRAALKIPEFCQAHGISTAFFYKLAKAGKAPRVTNLGARRIVTNEDAAAWRKRMAEASEQSTAA